MMSKEKEIEYWIIDVDGTLTDSTIYYDEQGNELKKFSVKDAAGMLAAQACGMELIVLTGRQCKATERRMQELKVDYLFQGIKDKQSFLKTFFEQKQIKREQVGYIGDDLNDLLPMQLASYVACPADACDEVRKLADYVSPVKGGYGAVREILSHVLKMRNEWETAVDKVFGKSGI